MSLNKFFAASLSVLLFLSSAHAQKAEVTVTLTDAFFSALLDSVFNNFDAPEFPIAQNGASPDGKAGERVDNVQPQTHTLSFAEATPGIAIPGQKTMCSDAIKILREMSGVRTAVRIRDGKIYMPIAFSGSYAPPFVGCVEFAGWADATIDLEFDQNGQRLLGRAHVLTVNLNGSGGLGGTLIAKLIQSSLDKKLNPLEIIRLDKLSFAIPIRNTGNLHLKATGIRPEILPGTLALHIDYEFLRG